MYGPAAGWKLPGKSDFCNCNYNITRCKKKIHLKMGRIQICVFHSVLTNAFDLFAYGYCRLGKGLCATGLERHRVRAPRRGYGQDKS